MSLTQAQPVKNGIRLVKDKFLKPHEHLDLYQRVFTNTTGKHLSYYFALSTSEQYDDKMPAPKDVFEVVPTEVIIIDYIKASH